MAETKIEWTDETWNPLRGCRRISPGCEHCYAERQAARPILSGPGKPYEGLVQFGKQGPRWTGASGGPTKLDAPLRWRKGRRIFPCSMSDLFYEGHPFGSIAAVFGVMAACPQHTFQVLTKRPERMVKWFEWVERKGREVMGPIDLCTILARNHMDDISDAKPGIPWPLPNVWVGVSVEDQQHAEQRLPHLLRIPAAVRFVSYEPALGPVDWRRWIDHDEHCYPDCSMGADAPHRCPRARLDWLIVGGESGSGARPFDLAWARSALSQCEAAGVPCFIKQMGARPITTTADDIEDPLRRLGGPAAGTADAWSLHLRDRKGGTPEEWPADLRVRQWPEPRRG